MRSFLLLVLIIKLYALEAQYIRGIVKDKETNEPLSFVNITINGGTRGTTSDLNGNFSLDLPADAKFLIFSYVGYKQDTVYIQEKKFYYEVFLSKKTFSLKEIVVLPGKNPAHRIIDSAIQHVDRNNPLNYDLFYAVLYSKFMITVDKDTLLQRIQKTKDTTYQKIKQFLDSQYILFMENVSEKFHKKPNLDHQKVLAARVSGIHDAYLSLINTQIQPFSFYKPFITISDKKYVNPISTGSTSKYFFLLEDTLYDGKDSIFVISFRPLRGKKFDGLKGVLYIHTAGWAIQSVIAEPYESGKGLSIRVKQSYFRPDSMHWFPKELQSDLIFNSVQLQNLPMIGRGMTFVRYVTFDTLFSAKKLAPADVYIDESAMERDSSFWNAYRTTPLTPQEKRTYVVLDSLNKKQKLDRWYEFMTLLMSAQIPIKWISISLNDLLYSNKVEGYRPGLKLSTNYRLSKLVEFFGYTGWGLKDEKLKWSVGTKLYIHRPRNEYAEISYDVWTEETGKSTLTFQNYVVNTANFRNNYLTAINYNKGYHASYHHRWGKYWDNTLKVFYENISAPTYMLDGEYLKDQFVGTSNFFTYGYSILLSSLYHLNFIQTPLQTLAVASNSDKLQIHLKWTHYLRMDGWKNTSGYKVLAEMKKQYTTKYAGTFLFRSYAGYASPRLPHIFTFHAPANYTFLYLFSDFSFETMRMNEFFSTLFLDVLAEYSLKNVLWKSNTYFSPYPILSYHAMWGTYSSKSHTDFSFQTPTKGYHEISLSLQGIVNIGQLDIGLASAYRLGAYAYPSWKDNLTLKIRIKTYF